MTTSAYDRIIDRLTMSGAVLRSISDGMMVQCPAHPDRNPSLHVTTGDRGAVMVCHAGCSTPDILTALGMSGADLFDEPLPARGPPALTRMRTLPAPQPVAEYLYEDGDGLPVLKVVRLALIDPATGAVTGKTFRQMSMTPAGWVPRIGDLEQPPLYHLPRVLAAVHAGVPVLVVEGEKDADSLTALGHVATCNPMGAGKWRTWHTAVLKGATVLIVADDDPPGHRHALAVQEALQPVAHSVVTLLPAPGCKDVTEHLEAGHGVPQLRVVDLAALPAPVGVHSNGRVNLTPASAFKPARVHWGWQGRMPVGELCLIPGREGVGKSLFLAWLAALLTTGQLPGEFWGDPRGVLYVASEDDWNYTIAPRMLVAGADLDLIFRVDVIEADLSVGRVTLPHDCVELADLARSVHAGAIMLDPIISIIDDGISVNQAGELRRALEPLRRAAGSAGVMVPALAHFNKMVDVDVLSKIPGARAWAEVARAAFGLAEDRDPDDEGPRTYVASQIKNNLGRLDLPHLTYRIDEVTIPTDDGDASVGRWVLTGESDIGVEEILSRRPATRSRDTGDTTKTLVDYVMSQAPHPVTVEQVRAEYPMINPDTLRRTLKRAADRGTLSNNAHGVYSAPLRVGTLEKDSGGVSP